MDGIVLLLLVRDARAPFWLATPGIDARVGLSEILRSYLGTTPFNGATTSAVLLGFICHTRL